MKAPKTACATCHRKHWGVCPTNPTMKAAERRDARYPAFSASGKLVMVSVPTDEDD